MALVACFAAQTPLFALTLSVKNMPDVDFADKDLVLAVCAEKSIDLKGVDTLDLRGTWNSQMIGFKYKPAVCTVPAWIIDYPNIKTVLLGMDEAQRVDARKKTKRVSANPKRTTWLQSELGVNRFKLTATHVKNLGTIEHLSLEGAFTTIASEVGKLSNLKSLTLNDTLIKSIPSEIKGMQSLESLVIERCPHLKTLPETLGNLANLNILEVKGTQVQHMPQNLWALQELSELRLNCNWLGAEEARAHYEKSVKHTTVCSQNYAGYNGHFARRLEGRAPYKPKRRTFPTPAEVMPKLTVVDLTHNKFPDMPAVFSSANLTAYFPLATVISDIPGTHVGDTNACFQRNTALNPTRMQDDFLGHRKDKVRFNLEKVGDVPQATGNS